MYDLIDINSNKLIIKISGNDYEDFQYNNTYVKRNHFDWAKLNLPVQKILSAVNEDAIKTMFLKIDRFNFLIKSPISSNDIELVKNLRNGPQLKADKNSDESDEKNDKVSEKKINKNETISRDILVKCLKYEKYLLKISIAENKTLSIQKLLDDFIAQNEVEKKLDRFLNLI